MKLQEVLQLVHQFNLAEKERQNKALVMSLEAKARDVENNYFVVADLRQQVSAHTRMYVPISHIQVRDVDHNYIKEKGLIESKV